MLDNLTQAQQIFSIFYAIFFGVMLQTIGAWGAGANGSLNLFDTPDSWAIGWHSYNRPFWRYIMSIAMLNILPAFIFAVIFSGLSELHGQLSIWQILNILWISLSPLHIYRLFIGLIVLLKDRIYLIDGLNTIFYKPDLDSVRRFEKGRLKYPGHKAFFNHWAISLFWILPSIFLSYEFLVQSHIDYNLTVVACLLIVIGLVYFKKEKEDKLQDIKIKSIT